MCANAASVTACARRMQSSSNASLTQRAGPQTSSQNSSSPPPTGSAQPLGRADRHPRGIQQHPPARKGSERGEQPAAERLGADVVKQAAGRLRVLGRCVIAGIDQQPHARAVDDRRAVAGGEARQPADRNLVQKQRAVGPLFLQQRQYFFSCCHRENHLSSAARRLAGAGRHTKHMTCAARRPCGRSLRLPQASGPRALLSGGRRRGVVFSFHIGCANARPCHRFARAAFSASALISSLE